MENQKNKWTMRKIITIVISVVIVLALVISVCVNLSYMNSNKQETKELNATDTTKEVKEVKEINDTDITKEVKEVKEINATDTTKAVKEIAVIPHSYVYTYIDGKVIHEWGTDYADEKSSGSLLYTSVRLPKINLNTEVAKSINNKILDKYKDEINVIKNNIVERKYTAGAFTQNLDYIYELKDNIAYILISDSVASFRASGGTNRENIIYDVKNDKQISITEMLLKLKITDAMIFDEVKSKYAYFDEIDESQVKDAIKNSKEDSITIIPEVVAGWYTLYLKVGLPDYEIRLHQ